jgi:hypothetical protein
VKWKRKERGYTGEKILIPVEAGTHEIMKTKKIICY